MKLEQIENLLAKIAQNERTHESDRDILAAVSLLFPLLRKALGLADYAEHQEIIAALTPAVARGSNGEAASAEQHEDEIPVCALEPGMTVIHGHREWMVFDNITEIDPPRVKVGLYNQDGFSEQIREAIFERHEKLKRGPPDTDPRNTHTWAKEPPGTTPCVTWQNTTAP